MWSPPPWSWKAEGEISEFPGGYDDWVNQRQARRRMSNRSLRLLQEKQKPVKPLTLRKLSFKEERELESLPLKIEKLETEQEEIFALLADINFYQRDPRGDRPRQRPLRSLGPGAFRSLSALGIFGSYLNGPLIAYTGR